MKKIFALLVVGVFAFSVIGCGGSTSSGPTGGGTPPKSTAGGTSGGTPGK